MEEVKDAVKKELEVPGRLLGYRAMHKKVRKEYNLHVTRDAVYNVMYMAMNILLNLGSKQRNRWHRWSWFK